MRPIARIVSLVALAATVVPCLLYFVGIVGHEDVTRTALLGTVVWFVATPIWMARELPIDATEVEI